VKHSVGVTISSVIVFLGSGATLLFWAFALLVVLFTRVEQNQLALVRYGGDLTCVVFCGFAAWGIASGVGLLRLREWARISVLVYSGFLFFASLVCLLIFLVIPVPPNVKDPETFRRTTEGMRIFMVAFFGIMFSLAIFWLWFFNTNAVREQFRGVAPGGPFVADGSRRPVSITIIGWYLLVTAIFYAANLFFHFPIFLFGFLVSGLGKTLFVLAVCVFHVFVGIGLLRLKPWAWIASICYFVFFLFNSFATVLIPGAQARLESARAEYGKAFGAPSQVFGAAQNPVHFPIWILVALTLPVTGVLLWFLATNKGAFGQAPPPLVRFS
jgi:hypothetical protein